MPVVLRPHQEANVATLLAALKTYGGALDASDTGTGKTYTVLALCKRLNARPAIVTRLCLIPSWQKAAAAIGVEPLFVTNYEQCKSAKFPWGTPVYKTVPAKDDKPETRVLYDYQWKIDVPRVIFVWDEAQALRDRTSGNSIIALAAFKRWKTVLLSATPFQTPMEAGVVGQVTRLFSENKFFSWMLQNGVRKNQYGRFAFIGDIPDGTRQPPGTNKARGLQFMEGVHRQLFPARGCRTRHEDIPDFPETVLCAESIETGEADAITDAYLADIAELRLRDHARAAQDVDPEFHDLVDPLPIVQMLRARQEAEVLKCSAIAEMARLAAEKGNKVAIFVNFDASIDILADYLKCRYLIRGDGSTRRPKPKLGPVLLREQAIIEFQSNRADFIIVNIRAGGVGLNLHDPEGKVPREALISPPYSAVDLKQVIGRVHRTGGAHSIQRILFAARTIEEKVMARVQARLDNIDALTDGDLAVTA